MNNNNLNTSQHTCLDLASSPGPSPFTSGRGPGNICDQNCCKLLQEEVQHQSDCSIFSRDKTSHLVSRDALSVYSPLLSVTRLETSARTSETQEGHLFLYTEARHCWKAVKTKRRGSFIQICPDSQLPSTDSRWSVCWKHYTQLSCCVRYRPIEPNIHGDSAIDLLATVALNCIILTSVTYETVIFHHCNHVTGGGHWNMIM